MMMGPEGAKRDLAAAFKSAVPQTTLGQLVSLARLHPIPVPYVSKQDLAGKIQLNAVAISTNREAISQIRDGSAALAAVYKYPPYL